MHTPVTIRAEGDQVLLGIASQSTAWLNVVDLEVGAPTAGLAAPAIPLQHLLARSATVRCPVRAIGR